MSASATHGGHKKQCTASVSTQHPPLQMRISATPSLICLKTYAIAKNAHRHFFAVNKKQEPGM